MTSPHVDPSVFDRLFGDRVGAPLGALELKALRLHVDECADCRAQFGRHRAKHLRGDDALTAGQVATILNVVLERGRELESPPGAAEGRPGSSRLRWGIGMGGVLAAACAAFLLIPAFRSGQREWGTRGAASSSPVQQLYCDDSGAGTARPIIDDGSFCPPGRAVSVEAHALDEFGWVSVVACDQSACQLVDSQPFDGRPTVSLFGPTMKEDETAAVFTIWSKSSVGGPAVQDAVKKIRSRGGAPDGANELPFDEATKQVVARIRGQRPPS